MTEDRYEHIVHPFPPLYDEKSRILILGSLPSVKSREQMFFYGHPQNRFWKVISRVLGEKLPASVYNLHISGISAPQMSTSLSTENAAFAGLVDGSTTGSMPSIFC